MILIDRFLLRSFFKAWAVCFFSLVSLYVVIDLFNKIDEFVEASDKTTMGLMQIISTYYVYQLILIFDRLCGVIILLAAMFTITWMQRNNELLPLLSAGVPTRRVLRPVFIGALVMLGISTLNREVLMPQVAEEIQRPANDPQGDRFVLVNGAYEPNGILISGQTAQRKGQIVQRFTCTIPEKLAGGLFNIVAKEAYYIPPGTEEHSGGWLLTETVPADLQLPKGKTSVIESLDPGKFFLKTERVDFDLVTRSRSWYQYASTWEIFEELERAGSARLAAMAVQLHMRITLPILTLTMVLMGVSMILRDQCRNVFLNAGLCLMLSAGFHAACFAAKYLGEQEFLTPPLSAWLPMLAFGPAALAMFDAIHT